MSRCIRACVPPCVIGCLCAELSNVQSQCPLHRQYQYTQKCTDVMHAWIGRFCSVRKYNERGLKRTHLKTNARMAVCLYFPGLFVSHYSCHLPFVSNVQHALILDRPFRPTTSGLRPAIPPNPLPSEPGVKVSWDPKYKA